jgi:hypothetical protein
MQEDTAEEEEEEDQEWQLACTLQASQAPSGVPGQLLLTHPLYHSILLPLACSHVSFAPRQLGLLLCAGCTNRQVRRPTSYGAMCRTCVMCLTCVSCAAGDHVGSRQAIGAKRVVPAG